MSARKAFSIGPVPASREPAGTSLALDDIDVRTPAVVLKFDQNAMHHGGLGVIRSLGRLGVPVYGVHEGPWSPAARSRYLEGRCFWQPPVADEARVLTDLRRLADSIGRPAVLLPTDDAGAIFVAEHAESLRSRFLFPEQPAGLPRRLASKQELPGLCSEQRFPCPDSVVPRSLAEATSFTTRAGFPVAAKLTAPWQDAGDLRSTTIVTGLAELEDLWLAADHAGTSLLLQEFVPGRPGDDWFFHGYRDRDGVCRPAFTGVKERSYPAGAGLTSFGRSRPSARLRQEVTGLLDRIGYHGICDLDLRFDARDGQYKLLDFNPRLGAQFRLFRSFAGVDVAIACYLDLTGQPIPDAGQVPGRAFLVENYDPLAAVSYWRRRDLRLGDWLRSVATASEAAWFAWDDPAPFGLMCLRMAGRLPAHVAARWQTGPGDRRIPDRAAPVS
ncbi:MAG: carboxylate--amine ligase [Actinomycetota bacterium]|jgi:predicted ATP-grasp superfamily ATP-dependent carboligase|nr:carboxylate--amine ligase [Actinomycetota bacterium]